MRYNQDAVRQQIQKLATPYRMIKDITDMPLPTGIDRASSRCYLSLSTFLLCKDAADDIKTTESAPFGKISGIRFSP